MLRSLGLSCDLAGDGMEAVEKCLEREYSAILMDCQMPGMDGFEATAPDPRRDLRQGTDHCTDRRARAEAIGSLRWMPAWMISSSSRLSGASLRRYSGRWLDVPRVIQTAGSQKTTLLKSHADAIFLAAVEHFQIFDLLVFHREEKETGHRLFDLLFRQHLGIEQSS